MGLRSHFGVAGLLVAMVACSSGSATQPPAGDSGCAQACAVCTSSICADCKAAAALYRDEFESALYACVVQSTDASSCANRWSTCAGKATVVATRRPIDDSYRDACLARRSECVSQGSSFADDDCLLSPILDPAKVAEAQACLAKPCPEVKGCLGLYFN